MALTLEQYATHLDARNLHWPAPPTVERPKARPHLRRLPGVRAVLWNVYGTLLAVAEGDLLDRKSTRLNSSHSSISYAVFCLKKKKKLHIYIHTFDINVTVCSEAVAA